MTDSPALQGIGLSMHYEGRVLFEQLNLVVRAGETLAVIGRSGCGKSTLLQILAGLHKPEQGQVLAQGRDITGVPGQVSLMFQHSMLLPWRSVLDNAILALEIAGHTKPAARQQASRQLAAFGLEGQANLLPHQISGGMAQRTALLRSFLHGSAVMLLDEPFGALDAITRRELHRWYRSLVAEKQLASVLVTHDIDEALVLAGRVLVFQADGTIVFQERPNDSTAHIEFRQRLLACL